MLSSYQAINLEQIMPEQSTTGIADVIISAGGQGCLARRIGVSQQAVSGWVKRGWVPTTHIVKIEEMFGVSRARLINPKHLAILTQSEG